MSARSQSTQIAWRDDVLPGFSRSSLGPATLVRFDSRPESPRGVVLMVHGYNDYFFQDHVARALVAAGYVFYALDARRAGRSLAPEDVPHFMADVAEQGEDIAAAADAVAALEPGLPLALHTHSTGSLTALIRLHDHGTGPVDALVLDAPYLGSVPSWRLKVGGATLPVLARRRPLAVVSRGPSWYATHQLEANGGRWNFDPRWKRPEGLPARAAWLHAVVRAQARVARGLELELPILVARAAEGGPDSPDNPLLDAQDTVVDLEAIARIGPRLGANVEELVVPDGVHDLTLSDDAPRAFYLDHLVEWLGRVLHEAGETDG
ncbi:serine aminopeptidase domain-containing protein [Demequina sp. NBRC 110054]|uniref:serine aminopeptidase domain-containing protein n=1 Tax=Demequina sp. NBRC 110054 TaxID=1570343 RepID=UPI001F2D74C1|nr:alpha/beta hydrolase [Demequina sp. NBRC 110054]